MSNRGALNFELFNQGGTVRYKVGHLYIIKKLFGFPLYSFLALVELILKK